MTLTKIEDAFDVPRKMLLMSGLWPQKNSTWKYKLRTGTSWVGILALTVTMLMELFNDLHDLTKLAGIIYILVSFFNAIAKQVGLTLNQKMFQEALLHLKNPVFTAYHEDLDHYMSNTVKFSTRLAEIYRILVGGYVLLVGLVPIIDKKPLPFPFPYDVGNYQILMYTFQLTCESISAWNHACLDTICMSLMGVASAQLDILSESIMKIKAEAKFYVDHEERDKVVLKQLKHCVDHHLAIIKHIDNIENIFGLGFSAQYLCSSLIVCITIFHFLLLPLSLQFVLLVEYMICVMTQLYLYCWYGNEILTKTLLIGDACYQFNWYDYGRPVRKCIFIIMERSKKPSCITALKFTTVSIQSLTNILQWSYSMLTLLLNVYKNG